MRIPVRLTPVLSRGRAALILGVIGALLTAALAYTVGSGHGSTGAQLEQIDQVLDTNARAIAVQAPKTAEAVRAAVATRAHRAKARVRVAVVSDSAVSIDGAPPVITPPALVNLIRRDDATIRQDSVARAELAVDRDLWRSRAQTLELKVGVLEDAQPWCGWRCGVIGTLAVIVTTAMLVF